MQHLILLLQLNLLELKRYLKLGYGTQFIPILQAVFLYNLIVWSLHTLLVRRSYRNLIFKPKSSLFDVFYLRAEIASLFSPLYKKDPSSLNARYFYRLYLGFWFIIFVATIIVFLPYTWTDSLGFHLRRLLAVSS